MPRPRPRRDALVTIERRLGAPRLFATAYSTVGSSIYFALGVVAAFALGLTPLVFLVAGLLFVITTLTYFEGMTLHPERGGSAVMARYAFNELLSFVAGWAILLDFLILIAISTLSIGHYLMAFWSGFGDQGLDLAIALLVLVLVARYNFLGKAPRGRRTIALSLVDMSLVLMIVGLGIATAFDPPAITDTVDLGSVPTWPDLLFGTTVAVIAYTGHRGSRQPGAGGARRAARRCAARSAPGAAVVLLVFVGMSAIALMALPVEQGVPMSVDNQTSGYGTALGRRVDRGAGARRRRGAHGRLRRRAARLRGRDRRDAGAEPGRERRHGRHRPHRLHARRRTARSRVGSRACTRATGRRGSCSSIFTVLAGAAPAAARHRAAGRHVRLRRPDRVRARAPVGVRAAVQGARPARAPTRCR